MKTKPCHLEIVAVLLLSVIPWPGPTVFKISCPRDRASVVRKIVQKRWIPILKKYQVELPLECPFHESRDIFHPQQAAKFQHRTSQWTCGLCGKSFYAEKHLDAHFDSRHRSNVNMAEDAVCLANYCDIMRCDVLGSIELENSLIEDTSLNTDIQVWSSSDSQKSSFGSSSCECREMARLVDTISDKSEIIPAISSYKTSRHCKRDPMASAAPRSPYDLNNGPENESTACDNPDTEEDDDDDRDHDRDETTNLVESSLPAAVAKRERNKEFEIRKLNCKPEELEKLKTQCQILVRDCIAGLLANLSVKDFQEIEGELNRAICWYLSCDRYWEDSKRQTRHTPWYLLIIFLLALSTGISVCYYVISIILGSGDDGSVDEDDRSLLHDSGGSRHLDNPRRIEIGEDRLEVAADMPDHYIYVAYPPELKRRLLESCYNRTTRL